MVGYINVNKEEIFINKTQWSNFSDKEFSEFKDKIFSYYREQGFPYYDIPLEKQILDLYKLVEYSKNNSILHDDGETLKQTMHCLGLCWVYHPHAWNVRCNRLRTPLEAFEDDDIFKKVINKRLKNGTYISDSGIRKMLKTYTGTQGVSNFRPSVAKWIYDTYSGDGVVWDMSCGYGGRLVGALLSDKVKRYIGTEPQSETVKGLGKMLDNFSSYFPKEVFINQLGSEDFTPDYKSLDLCFTSPPYFNTEVYGDSQYQSCNRYITKESWLNDFLGKTIKNCYYGLKDDGTLIINIANVRPYKDLEKDFLKVSGQFFKLEKVLKYSLSGFYKQGFKYEPMFVMKKK